MRTVNPFAVRSGTPQRFHVRLIDPLRQSTVGRDLGAFHISKRVDFPQSLTYRVVAESAHRTQGRVDRCLRAKAAARTDVMRDHPGVDALNRDSGTALPEPSSPTIQPRFRVRHRPITQSSGPVLLHVCLLQPIPSPHRRSPYVPAGELSLAGLNVTKTNNTTSNMTSLEVAMSPELN